MAGTILGQLEGRLLLHLGLRILAEHLSGTLEGRGPLLSNTILHLRQYMRLQQMPRQAWAAGLDPPKLLIIVQPQCGRRVTPVEAHNTLKVPPHLGPSFGILSGVNCGKHAKPTDPLKEISGGPNT